MGRLRSLIASERAKGIFSVILYFILLVVGQMLAVVILQVIRGLTGFFDEDLFNNMVTWISLVISLVVFIIIYFKVIKEDAKRLNKKDMLFVIVMAIITLILNYGSNAILDYFNVSQEQHTEVAELLAANTIITMIITVVYGPIVEELVFRKAINQIVSNKAIFIAVSALIFGLIHEQNLRMIPFVCIGAICAITYLKTNKNVVSAIAVHFINNLVFTVWMFFE